MARVFSGIQPTGEVHLGNYLGALVNWVEDQHQYDSIYCVVDLHGLTTPQDPSTFQAQTLSMAQMLLAVGLDPEVCTLFVQSQVHQHAELSWLLQCISGYGQLKRMTQFKDKAAKQETESVGVGLFTYPTLMAADILLYDTARVPVGDDQRQHLELTRDLAERFNSRFGETFVVPEAAIPKEGARVMDLQNPTNKMSKSDESDAGVVYLLDEPKAIEKKFKRAVTDSDNEVHFDREKKPGIANLLSINASVTGRTPEKVAEQYSQYGALKVETAEAVIERLRPVRERYDELAADRGATTAALVTGATKAEAIAAPVLARAQAAMGLLPR